MQPFFSDNFFWELETLIYMSFNCYNDLRLILFIFNYVVVSGGTLNDKKKEKKGKN